MTPDTVEVHRLADTLESHAASVLRTLCAQRGIEREKRFAAEERAENAEAHAEALAGALRRIEPHLGRGYGPVEGETLGEIARAALAAYEKDRDA